MKALIGRSDVEISSGGNGQKGRDMVGQLVGRLE